MAENKRVRKTVRIEEVQTTEDKILGNPKVVKTKVKKTYEDSSISYKITNLQVDNKPVIVTGELVETFIGCKNLKARNDLKDGTPEVITKDLNGNDMYKIEVIN